MEIETIHDVVKFYREHRNDKPLAFCCQNPWLCRHWKAVPLGRLFQDRLWESLIDKL